MENLSQTVADIATKLRIHSVEMTNASASGHPSSCASMADLIATLFFHPEGMRYNPEDPKSLGNDKFILSKGHAAPILYAAWAEAGYVKKEDLLNLRKLDSDLEGHPTPRLAFVDVATGSLGQGLSASCGMAYSMKNFEKRSNRIYCLLGDAEMAEGSNWEAMNFASYYNLDNLVAIVDVNRLGQSDETSIGHNLDIYKARFEAFGFDTQVIDGHSIDEIVKALVHAKTVTGKPQAILAKTFKGKDLTDTVEDICKWHGKPMADQSEAVIKHLKSLIQNPDAQLTPTKPAEEVKELETIVHKVEGLTYKKGDMIATRATFGVSLRKMGEADPRIIGLDADVKNSTMSIKLKEVKPEQFVDCFVAEQNLAGVSLGVGTRNKIPFCATFSAFFTRCADQIRMGAVSFANVKYVGTHCGVSIGLDGPSQMGLEDLGLFRSVPNSLVFYPSDAVSFEWAMVLAANYQGNVYIRANRPATEVLYDNDEVFEIGKNKIVSSHDDDKITIVGAGITLYEAHMASQELAKEGINVAVLDVFSVKPFDKEGTIAAARKSENRLLVVEDHYPEGGIGDATRTAVAEEGDIKVFHLAVRELPRSGKPQELLEHFGIDRKAIIKKVKEIIG